MQLKDAFIIISEPFIDNRGMFERIFCKNEFNKIGLKKEIVQVNHSLTKKKGSIRGMHYQIPPFAEIKIVRCIKGSVFDVIIDIRKYSETFLKWQGEILSSENMKLIYIPEGFAHGFQTLEDDCELLYFHTESYNKNYERAIRYNDPLIGIKWKIDITEISEKDKNHLLLNKNFQGVIF
jgi:dTDP-4-dehydrorhamnose 3,5-epimerase